MGTSERRTDKEIQRAIGRIHSMLEEGVWVEHAEVRERLLNLLHEYGPQVMEGNLAALSRGMSIFTGRIADSREMLLPAKIAEVGALWLLQDGKAEDRLIEIAQAGRQYDQSDALQALCRIEIAKSSGKAVPVLIGVLLNDKKAFAVRAYLAEEMGRITWDERVVDGLIKALVFLYRPQDPNGGLWAAPLPSISERAAMSLMKIGDKRGLAAVVPLLLSNEKFCSRTLEQKPIDTLQHMGQVVVEPLIGALHHEDRGVRRAAAVALGRIGDGGAVAQALMLALKDEDKQVRMSAAEGLGMTGDEKVVGPLTQALKDKDGKVRKAAERALKEIEKRRS